MAVDAAKQGTALDLRSMQPFAESRDGTPSGSTKRDGDLATYPALIGFRPSQMDDQPLLDHFDVLFVQTDELRTAKAAGKSDQEQCAITDILQISPGLGEDGEQLIPQQGLRLAWWSFVPAHDAPHRRLHER